MKVIRVHGPGEQIHIDIPSEYRVVLDSVGSSCCVIVINRFQSNLLEDFQITIHHKAPNTEATTTMKSVVGRGGSVKLVGKIVIEKGAYGCSSFLTQRILLLDESARGETVPELEILNNEVRCSHAASISSIPEEQLHYLQARGLTEVQATKMIAEGFLKG